MVAVQFHIGPAYTLGRPETQLLHIYPRHSLIA